MDIEKDSNREAFESWFESRYDANFMQFALDLDMYVDKHTQTCWEAWQAAKAQAVQEWISVEDNLPNRQANVLVASKHDFVCIASLTNNHKNNKFYDGDGFAINSITHWMPLPKLPKAQEQADAL